MSPGDDGTLDVGSTLFVGGTSNKQQLPWPLYSRLRDFYRGCIWDLRLDGGDIIELQQLWRDQGMPGISAGQLLVFIAITVIVCTDFNLGYRKRCSRNSQKKEFFEGW